MFFPPIQDATEDRTPTGINLAQNEIQDPSFQLSRKIRRATDDRQKAFSRFSGIRWDVSQF